MGDKNMRPNSLHDFQSMLAKIYADHNKRTYGFSALYALQLNRGIGIVSECLRKDNGDKEIIRKLPLIFGWLMALWNDLDIDIENVTWHKFPGICPYCRVTQNCLCIADEKKYDEKESLNVYRRDHSHRPKTLSDWQTLHMKIYGRVNKIKMRVQVWDHFVEEFGEVCAEMLLERRKELENECADVMMWLLAFCNRISVNLDELTWQKYPGECNACQKEQCECPRIAFE